MTAARELGELAGNITVSTTGLINIDSNTLYVDGVNNRVGIGTSSPAVQLEVSAGTVRSSGATGGSFAQLNGGNADGANFQLCRGGSASQNAFFSQYQGSLYIKNLDSGPILFTNTTGDLERMRISSGGDVSIGTTSAYYAQANRTTFTLAGTTDSVLSIGGGGVASGYLYGSSGILQLVADSKPLYLVASGNNIIYYLTNGVERMRIEGSGNTVVTGNVLPNTTNTVDLGSAAQRWRNIYTQDLHLSNGIGDWTVVEGEENLYIVNNKSGKSFKFALIEVDPGEVPPKSAG